ncbi:RabGAP/TBC [Yamadazyma tenuis ATCC 10573]|nr:RabGAP/TBC [Yamadazyma tenuis ATCC 10573]EGV64815.1 RabGAP/TBC [Yamadazyma tenuis ATCC 10573]
MLYKFDRLMEIYHPSLFNHLIKRGIRSNSFASQWFLTLFSYKFPIDVILRIYDFVIFEGVDFLLKLALRLMALNESILLRLNSDSLLAYLNTNILDVLVRKDFQPGSNQYYDTSKIFTGFTNLNPNLLQKFEAEFQKLYALNEKKLDDINLLNLTNGKLRNQIKYLQMDLFNLNKDHLQVVQGLINLKVRLPELMSQNSDLEDDIQSLINTLNDMKDFKEDDVPHNIEQHIEQLLVENKSETERNIALEDQLNELVEQEHQVDSQLKALKKGWFWNK